MSDHVRAVILRTRLFSETSLIVHWLTRDEGRISTIARGAQRPKSSFRGKLDLMHECDILVRRSRRSELHTLGEARFLRSWPALRLNLALLRQASCAIRWMEMQTEVDTPIPGLFDLFCSFLDCLEKTRLSTTPLLAFETRFLEILGQPPLPENLRLSPGGKQLLGGLGSGSWDELTEASRDSKSVDEVQRFLHGFLVYNLGQVPKGRAAALEPF